MKISLLLALSLIISPNKKTFVNLVEGGVKSPNPHSVPNNSISG